MFGETSAVTGAGGVQLCAHRRRGAGPAVILAHGITDQGRSWSTFAQHLPAEWDAFALDARGHGASARADAYTYALLAADVAAAVVALGLRRPALVGHSMGAETVALCAARHPDLAACVVLEDPPWREAERAAPDRRKRADAWRADLEAAQAGTVDGRVAALRRLRRQWSDAERRGCAEAERATDPQVLDLVAEGTPAWRETVAAIRCPILLVCGEPGRGAIVTAAVAALARAHSDRLRVAAIPGAGHCVRRDRPDEYADVVTAFLREHLEGGAA